jgi:5-hydroxyisourate hydrolase
MSPITTHVLDTAAGRPAAGIGVALEFRTRTLARGTTDADGRVRDLLPDGHLLEAGVYSLRFDTRAVSPFFPEVTIQFQIDDARQHYHVPLLLSPYGYSTYRGS